MNDSCQKSGIGVDFVRKSFVRYGPHICREWRGLHDRLASSESMQVYRNSPCFNVYGLLFIIFFNIFYMNRDPKLRPNGVTLLAHPFLAGVGPEVPAPVSTVYNLL